MKILFFCENANQVFMSNSIIDHSDFSKDITFEFLMLDWNTDGIKWVSRTLSKLNKNYSLSNIFSNAPPLLKSEFTKAKDKKNILADMAFDYFKSKLGDDLIIVQFNDMSVRGSTIARVSRNIGIKRLLIQDGFLNFCSKTNQLHLTDQNYGWGSSQPEYIAVWGQKMKDALIERHLVNDHLISVVGALKENFSVPTSGLTLIKSKPTKVLWADQAIIDQRKADENSWLKEFQDISKVLSSFNTTLRLHPSTTSGTKLKLEKELEEEKVEVSRQLTTLLDKMNTAKENTRERNKYDETNDFLDVIYEKSNAYFEEEIVKSLYNEIAEVKEKLENLNNNKIDVQFPQNPYFLPGELEEYDVVVTYYSTVFLDCIKNNIPCIIFRTTSIDIELPYINHPLMMYCDTIEELNCALNNLDTISFKDIPDDLLSYISSSDDSFLKIADLLSRAVKDITAAIKFDYNPNNQIFTVPHVSRLQNNKILVLGGSFGEHIGVGKPIRSFYEYTRNLFIDIDFHLVTGGSIEFLIEKLAKSSILIINSIEVAKILSETDFLAIKKICEMRSIPMFFYCHETSYVYERLNEAFGGRIQSFTKKVLPDTHILAVSDKQADWLGSLGGRSIRTVYNCLAPIFEIKTSTDEYPLLADKKEKIVLMVGTQQKRKGIELFSHVADLAKSKGHDWKFVWLGAYTKGAKGCYQSNNVDWVGYVSQTEVAAYLKKSQVFFLSSVDDPMPLSVGEALLSDLPCLVYKDTGYSSFVEYFSCGEVYYNYNITSAYKKLTRIMQAPELYVVDKQSVYSLIGIHNFGVRMLQSISEVVAGTIPKYLSNQQMAAPVALHRYRGERAAPPQKNSPTPKNAAVPRDTSATKNVPTSSKYLPLPEKKVTGKSFKIVRKLFRNPHAFFSDSSYSIIRPLKNLFPQK